jgi:hypothetical protein
MQHDQGAFRGKGEVIFCYRAWYPTSAAMAICLYEYKKPTKEVYV